jgi:hypothetical protein
VSKTTTSPLLWLPSAAAGIQLTPSGTAWTNTSWVQLTASAPSRLYSAYLAILPNNGAVVAQLSVEIDIGVGGAGSEVVVATVRARVMADLWGPVSTVPLGALHAFIAAGTRVALRVRHGATGNTNVYRVALGYYADLGGASGYSTSAPTVAPLGASFVTVTSGGSAWGFGSWVEVLSAAAVTSAIRLTGFVATNIGRPHEIQIGYGAAGSEVAKMTLPYSHTGGGGDGFNYVRFPRPLCVSSGTRISVRSRCGTTLQTFNPTVWYVAA